MGTRKNDLIKLANKIERKIIIEKISNQKIASRSFMRKDANGVLENIKNLANNPEMQEYAQWILMVLQMAPVPPVSLGASAASAAIYMKKGDMGGVFFCILTAIPGLNEVCPVLYKMMSKYPSGMREFVRKFGAIIQKIDAQDKALHMVEKWEKLLENKGKIVTIFLKCAMSVHHNAIFSLKILFSEMMAFLLNLHNNYISPFAEAAGVDVSPPPIAELEAEFDSQIAAISNNSKNK
jgi:hypothetical protein